MNDHSDAIGVDIPPGKQLEAIVAPLLELTKKAIQAYVNACRSIIRAIEEAQREPTTPLERDLRQMRRLGQRERRAARAHLRKHVDSIYEDLGLERPK